jgi:hypothetical protein
MYRQGEALPRVLAVLIGLGLGEGLGVAATQRAGQRRAIGEKVEQPSIFGRP